MSIDETSGNGEASAIDLPFEAIPRRVFLDTNVVDCLVKWGECVFESRELPDDLPEALTSDITSLTNIFLVGQRANWDIVVSSKTLHELSQTQDEYLRQRLVLYGNEVAEYATINGLTVDDHQHASDLARRLGNSEFLQSLPGASDRELVAHAVAFGCDTFCTRDRRSIHRHRGKLRQIPLQILSPAEWWQHIRPWAGLWL